MRKILIAEDDITIAEIEKDYLEVNGFEVDVVYDGTAALEAVREGKYNLLLLDIMMPGLSGFDVCKQVRDIIDIPILMVTAKMESFDKVRGLGFGADDYITKPFDPAELVARVKSHLARYERLKQDNTLNTRNEKDEELIIGDLRILTKGWKVYVKGKECKFANREFELLVFLANNPNIVFSKDTLFERIWGYDFVGDSTTVAVHINRIREKIEDDPGNPCYIETVWGAGYRFNM